jgi:hypothetical protein
MIVETNYYELEQQAISDYINGKLRDEYCDVFGSVIYKKVMDEQRSEIEDNDDEIVDQDENQDDAEDEDEDEDYDAYHRRWQLELAERIRKNTEHILSIVSNSKNSHAANDPIDMWHGDIYTYVIGCDELRPVKIGKTINLNTRLAQINTGSPYKYKFRFVIYGDYEELLHNVFSEYNVKLEWFELNLRILEKYLIARRIPHKSYELA